MNKLNLRYKKTKRNFIRYILFLLIFFQIISAIPAGFLLIYDPSGSKLGYSLEQLNLSPFPNFLIPGLFLFTVLGLFPIIIFYGLIKKPTFKLAEKINLYKNYHWSWTFSYYLGMLLILWINIQLYFIREFSILHFIYSLLGVLIIFITFLPVTKKEYKKRHNKK